MVAVNQNQMRGSSVDTLPLPFAARFRPHPRHKPGLTAYRVKDELVLLPDLGDKLYALNSAGASIWDLCDGCRSVDAICDVLIRDFDGDKLQIAADLNAALLQLRELDLLEISSPADKQTLHVGAVDPAIAQADRPPVRIVHGIEDRPYFHWQLAIMFESLVGQLPAGWDIVVVVCNNHAAISAELATILSTYRVAYHTGNSPADNHDIDFAGGGDRYAPMNRVEALNVMRQHAASGDLLCLMDTDIYLFGELQPALFPRGNAMASNWIVGQERFFHFSTADKKGLSLPKLLDAFGYADDFKPGGVMVFITGEALQKNDGKLVRDCFRFLQILYLAGKILELPPHGVWVAEMACFALAMQPSEIDYELLDIQQFAVQDPNADSLPEGSFHHYYADKNDSGPGPFVDSAWHKQLFSDKNFLHVDIESFLMRATGAAEKEFMRIAIRARERIYGGRDG
ncbi:MAG: PqqD family protein [Congregibacter sp.]